MLQRAAVLAGLLSVVAASARTQETDTGGISWSGQVGLASGLVYRGIRLNDETLVPDLDIAIEHASGLYLNGWLTRVELPQPAYYAGADSMWQTVLGAGYNWRVSPAWTLSLAHNWYLYSDALPERRPDYREWLLSADYNNLLVFDYSHAKDWWGLEGDQDTLSVGIHWPFSPRLIGAATLGLVEQEGHYQDSYRYLRLNLGYLLARDWSVQLQYHDSFGVGDFYRNAAASREWVAQVSWYW